MNALAIRKLAGSRSEKLSLASIIEPCVTVPAATPAIEVLELFLADRERRVIPVVNGGRPVGMTNRNAMVEMFSRPFRRDLFGRRPIEQFMDASPIVVHIATDIDDLAQMLVSAGLQQMLDGFVVVDEAGTYAGIGNAQDLLSEVTKRKQAHLYQLAHYDALTNLPNRILFRDRLSMSLGQAARKGTLLAVVFIDIDNFKRINDSLGHPAGDQLLQGVARRFEKSLRDCDTLARMGGDEFTLVLNDLTHARDAATVVRKLRNSLAAPMRLADREMVITASIGIAVHPDDGGDMDELVRKADIALYAAKQAGRDTYRFFDNAHDAFDDSRLFLEHELRLALQQEQIRPVFQALVDARDGQTIGVEALARWRHADKGSIPPSVFVPLAEDTGLIRPLGQAIAQLACQAMASAPELDGMRLSLNSSILELRADDFVDNFLDRIAENGLRPERVQLEITERILIEPSDKLLDKFRQLRRAGVTIAIDDFGVGSTSLRLLHELPIDVLKIDRSFVSESDTDPRVDHLIQAIIDVGHALDLQIVAEGVETQTQAQRLAEYGCDFLQGYLFCEPLPPDGFASWYRKRSAN